MIQRKRTREVMRPIMLVGLLLVLVAIVIVMSMWNYVPAADKIPTLQGDDTSSVEENPAIIFRAQSFEREDILGSWKQVSEDSVEGTRNDVEGSVVYYEDGRYDSVREDIRTEGYYKVEDNKIWYFDTREQLEIASEGTNFAEVQLDRDVLKVRYPPLPNVLTYERV